MSDSLEPTPPDIRSIDDLNTGKAFAVGVISTCIMGLVPILNELCCLHFCVGAFLTIWVYTASNEVTVGAGHAIWVAFKAVLVGALFSTAIYWGYTLAVNGADLSGFKQQIFDKLAAQGRDDPNIIEMIDKFIPDEPGPAWIAMASVFFIFTSALSALFGASIGGALASAVFKKGPLAQ